MKQTHRGMITLLKSALTGQPETLPEDFHLDEAAVKLCREHHMAPLIYDGARVCGIGPKEPAMQELFKTYCAAAMVCDRQQKALAAVVEAFRREDIDYMLLKGSRLRPMYPRPELRYMGDADILIRPEQYEKIGLILKELGFSFDHETDHELVWRSRGLYLELHKHLIPSYNKDFYSYYGDGWQLAVKGEGSEYTMKPEDEWIYLFTHFAKHYRDGGAGCRYVVDLWLWRKNYPEMDEAYIRDVLKKMHLEEFHGHIMELLEYWFGQGTGSDILDILTEFTLSSGSWGQHEAKVLSVAIRDAKHASSGLVNRLVFLWKHAFPDVRTLRDKYKILYKAPWMLPVVWLVRPFYKVIFERESVSKKMEDVQLLSEENLELRQQMLDLVGLDYNF